MNLNQLQRVRHGARGVRALGVMVSIVANVLHAADNLISQAIAAWAPIALMLTIELIARVPVRKGLRSVSRLVAMTAIAGIAAWVSYWHMVGVAVRYGEESGAAHLIPLTVDGLVVVAWVSLVEVAGRIRELPQPVEVAQSEIEDHPPARPKAPIFLAPVSAPPGLPDEPVSGAPVADDLAGQKMRQDARSAQQIEDAVRAMHRSDPKLSQRKIADVVLTSPTNVRRIFQAMRDEEVAHPVNGREPEFAEVSE